MHKSSFSSRTDRHRNQGRPAAGFTLIEALVGISILLVITAAVFTQIQRLQKNSSSEGMKLDLTQESRAFIDQIVRDIHMTGYPKPAMYSAGLDNTSPLVAAGLVRVSPTEILLEGDVDTSGTVSSVDITYVASDPNDPNCPCVRRSAAPKIAGSPLSQGTSATPYMQVEQVFPPGTGAGQSGEDLFTFYDVNGVQVPVTGGIDINSDPTDLNRIKTVKVNLSLKSKYVDSVTRQPARISMSVTGNLNSF